MKPTCKEIFKNGQVLTIGKAKELIGKYIYITNFEYWGNEPTVRRVMVDPISEWDAAAKDHTAKGFDSRQEYWASYMTEKQVERVKNSYSIGLNELGNLEGKTSGATDDTPFYGSDEDREIYYIVDK
jgi:hypothetical protein